MSASRVCCRSTSRRADRTIHAVSFRRSYWKGLWIRSPRWFVTRKPNRNEFEQRPSRVRTGKSAALAGATTARVECSRHGATAAAFRPPFRLRETRHEAFCTMAKLNLSIAVGDYDRTRPLIDGTVAIDGVD